MGLYGCVGFLPSEFWLHSSSSSLWINGLHNTSIAEERLNHAKYSGEYPQLSIDYCLNNANLKKENVNIVCYAENIHSLYRKDSIKKVLQREFPNAEIEFCGHHEAHVYSSVFTSGFDECCFFSADGAGNSVSTRYQNLLGYETAMYGFAKDRQITVLHHAINGINIRNEFNICQVYNNISRYIYSVIEPERFAKQTNIYLQMETCPGKIMGLSAYGNYKKVDLDDLFEVSDDSYFPTIYDRSIPTDSQLDQYAPEDISAWLQKQYENSLYKFFSILKNRGLTKGRLCGSGGGFLNVLANSRLYDLFDEIYVPPFCADVGLAIGAALFACNKHEENFETLDTAYLGKLYSDEEVEKELKKCLDK